MIFLAIDGHKADMFICFLDIKRKFTDAVFYIAGIYEAVCFQHTSGVKNSFEKGFYDVLKDVVAVA